MDRSRAQEIQEEATTHVEIQEKSFKFCCAERPGSVHSAQEGTMYEEEREEWIEKEMDDLAAAERVNGCAGCPDYFKWLPGCPYCCPKTYGERSEE